MEVGVCALSFHSLGCSTPVPSPHFDHVVHETRAAEPTHWVNTGRPVNAFWPCPTDMHRLEEMLMSVFHPQSPRYAQHFWLDAVDASYCGGDDSAHVSDQIYLSLASPHHCELLIYNGIYPDPFPGGYDGRGSLQSLFICKYCTIGPESCGVIKPPNVVSISSGLDEATTASCHQTVSRVR